MREKTNHRDDLESKPQPGKSAAICIAMGGLVLVAAASTLLLKFMINHGVHYERSLLKDRTAAIAASLDIDSIRALTGGSQDEHAPQFKTLVARLRGTQKNNADIRFFYLMGLKDNTVRFLLDSTDPNAVEYSPPGEPYEEATPELVRSFANGEPFVEGPVADRWGEWVSGLVPIKDPSSNRVIAVFGMDVDANRWRITRTLCRTFVYLVTSLLAWIVLSSSRSLHRGFAKSNQPCGIRLKAGTDYQFRPRRAVVGLGVRVARR